MKLLDIWPFRPNLHRAHLRASQSLSDCPDDLDLARLRLREFENVSADWLWETNAAGELVYLSAKLADVVDRPLDQLLGKRLSEVSGLPGHLGRWRSLDALMNQHRPLDAMEVPVKISGERRWWQLTGNPLAGAGADF